MSRLIPVQQQPAPHVDWAMRVVTFIGTVASLHYELRRLYRESKGQLFFPTCSYPFSENILCRFYMEVRFVVPWLAPAVILQGQSLCICTQEGGLKPKPGRLGQHHPSPIPPTPVAQRLGLISAVQVPYGGRCQHQRTRW